MSELRPLEDKVLLIPYIEKQTAGGIVLPSSVTKNEIPPAFIVSAIGPEVKNPDLKEGTVVVIPRRTGTWVPFEDFKYVLVNESDILCIMEGATYQKPPTN